MFFLFELFSNEPEVFLSEYSQTAILHAASFRRVVNDDKLVRSDFGNSTPSALKTNSKKYENIYSMSRHGKLSPKALGLFSKVSLKSSYHYLFVDKWSVQKANPF